MLYWRAQRSTCDTTNDRRTNENATQPYERSHSTTLTLLSLFCLRFSLTCTPSPCIVLSLSWAHHVVWCVFCARFQYSLRLEHLIQNRFHVNVLFLNFFFPAIRTWLFQSFDLILMWVCAQHIFKASNIFTTFVIDRMCTWN